VTDVGFMMTIEFSMLAPHVPSMCHEDLVPEFQQDMAFNEGNWETAEGDKSRCNCISFMSLAIYFIPLCRLHARP
jgi:hypothetical protein